MSHDPTDIAGLQDAQDAAAKRTQDALRVEKDDIVWLMNSRRGRRVVARLLGEGGPHRATFDTNALRMAFNEGARSNALRLLDKVTRYALEQYTQMLKEQNADG